MSCRRSLNRIEYRSCLMSTLAQSIDRNSLFECRGGAPYKSTVKQYFHRFTETALCSKCKCLAALWRIGDFCPICGSISSNSTTSAVFAGRENFMRQPRRLSNRVYHTCFSAVDRTRINNQSPQSSSGIGSSRHSSMTSWPHAIVSVAGGPVLGAMRTP